MRRFVLTRCVEFLIVCALYGLMVLFWGIVGEGERLPGEEILPAAAVLILFTAFDWLRQQVTFGFLAVQALWMILGHKRGRGAAFVVTGQSISLLLHFLIFELRPHLADQEISELPPAHVAWLISFLAAQALAPAAAARLSRWWTRKGAA